MAQKSINFALALGLGVIPIPGAKTAEQVRQNAGALGFRLSDSDAAQLDRVARPAAELMRQLDELNRTLLKLQATITIGVSK